MGLIMTRAGDVLGVLGIIVSLAAGATRLSGEYQLLGADSISIYHGGIGLMVAACLLKLWSMERTAAS